MWICSTRNRSSHLPTLAKWLHWQAQDSCDIFRRCIVVFWQAGCQFHGRHGIFWHVLKIDESLTRNIDVEVTNLQILRKTLRKTSILKLQSVKIEKFRTKWSFWCSDLTLLLCLFSCSLAVFMGKASNCENWRKTSDELLVFLTHVLSRSPCVCVSVAVSVGEGGNNESFEFFTAGCLF